MCLLNISKMCLRLVVDIIHKLPLLLMAVERKLTGDTQRFVSGFVQGGQGSYCGIIAGQNP